MKKLLFFTSVLFISSYANAQKTFEDVMSAATYAKKHVRQAFIVNNIEQSHQYSEKAIEALNEVERLTDLFGCLDANSLAYDARDNVESSIEQDTWERSRFYAKRAEKITTELLIELNKCDIKTSIIPSNDSSDEASNDDGVSSEIASTQAAINQHQNQMDAQRAELLRKQQELEAQQKRLEQQIALQKEKQAKLEAKRAAELKRQAIVQTKAEEALLKLEAVLEELSLIFDNQSMFASEKRYIRDAEILQSESLKQTKSFYAKEAKKLSEIGIKQFSTYIRN